MVFERYLTHFYPNNQGDSREKPKEKNDEEISATRTRNRNTGT